ncbi:MAG: ATP-binding cassette domain-containing protein, partial [Stackebrandtia sp.]
YVDSDAAAEGVPLRDIPLDALRRLILVADNDGHLFAGPLREALDVHGAHDDAQILDAVRVAVAGDAVDSLGGLDGELDAEGRNVSGGQRQRLRLARSLLVDPEVLILLEPTSAVDAHTESRVAERLAAARRGRTTVVASTSPLMLEHADQVAFVSDGKVKAVGPHRLLWKNAPEYRALVARDAQEDE